LTTRAKEWKEATYMKATEVTRSRGILPICFRWVDYTRLICIVTKRATGLGEYFQRRGKLQHPFNKKVFRKHNLIIEIRNYTLQLHAFPKLKSHNLWISWENKHVSETIIKT
jgi:hypothetical protein